MADNWYVGNAVADGQGDNRGWLIGHFLEGSAGVRSSDAVEVKWGITQPVITAKHGNG